MRLSISAYDASPAGEAEFLCDDIHEIGIATRAEKPSTLVMRDTWYPGLKAFADGVPTEIKPAGGCFRSLQVPDGKYVMSLSYSPGLWYT